MSPTQDAHPAAAGVAGAAGAAAASGRHNRSAGNFVKRIFELFWLMIATFAALFFYKVMPSVLTVMTRVTAPTWMNRRPKRRARKIPFSVTSSVARRVIPPIVAPCASPIPVKSSFNPAVTSASVEIVSHRYVPSKPPDLAPYAEWKSKTIKMCSSHNLPFLKAGRPQVN